MTNEAFARVQIDALLAAQGWYPQDPNAVRYEVVRPDGKRADCVLCDRRGRSLAVLQVPIDRRIVERDDQLECIDTLCQQNVQGRRKLLVEKATGTGETRTAAALIKRLCGVVWVVLGLRTVVAR